MLLLLNVLATAQDVVVIKKNTKDTTEKPLIVVDGVLTENTQMDAIPPSDIESVNVLKGASAREKYGKRGQNGVVEIISKNKNKGLGSTIDTNVNLSIVVDGDKITINGQPADKNDPRLKIMGKPHLGKPKKGNDKEIIIQDQIISDDPNVEEEGSDDVMDMLTPQVPTSNKAFLGVITEATEKGAKINTVSEESPAAKAGLKQDDIIKKVNDKIIDGPKALYEAIGQFKPDEKVVITYLRDNKELTTTATLAKNKATNMGPNYRFNMQPNFRMRPDQQFNFQMPEMEGLMNRMDKKPKIGISIEDLTIGEGVKITDVNEGSAAEKAGLKKNDIILAVNGKKIKDVDAVKAELKIAVEGTKLPIQAKRDKEIKTIELIIPKKIKTANL